MNPRDPHGDDGPATEHGTVAIPRVYVAQPGPGRTALLCLLVGVVALAGCVAMLGFAIRTPATPERDFQPGLNAWFIGQLGLGLVGIFTIMTGVWYLRTARRVELDDTGLTIQTWLSRKRLRWTDIARVSRQRRTPTYSSTSFEMVDLLDGHGRRRASIADSIENFEDLVASVIHYASDTPGEVVWDAERDGEQRVAQSRRQIRWAGWAFLLFTAGMLCALGVGIHEEIHLRRFATEGRTVDAKIERAWTVRVTPRVEYSFQDETGRTFRREATMFVGPEWQNVQNAATVPVQYLPSAPEWNRLVSGEDAGPQFGGSFLFVTGFGVLMFGALAAFALSGYDMRSEDGVTTLLRHGEVLRQWGQVREKTH